jgi:arsenate reductase-like glutaredoxin family protein
MITLYSKKNCAMCDSAKDKLRRLGLAFSFVNVTELDNWRNDARVDFTVEKTWREDNGKPELPLLSIDGKWYDYPEAMAVIRKSK